MVEDLEEARAAVDSAAAQEEADSEGAAEALTEVDSEVQDPRTDRTDRMDLGDPEVHADLSSAAVGSIDRITAEEDALAVCLVCLSPR